MPTKKVPRIERQCVTCGVSFIGTPRNTRCTDCRSAGRKIRYRKCLECNKPFVPSDKGQHSCAPCTKMLGIGRGGTPPKRVKTTVNRGQKAAPDKPVDKTEINRQRREKFIKERDAHLEDLGARSKPLKGRKLMTKEIEATTLGELWLSVCAYDGCVVSAARFVSHDLSQDDCLRILGAYQRLRLDGFKPEALARLCPKALLEGKLALLPDDIPRPDLNAVRLGLA